MVGNSTRLLPLVFLRRAKPFSTPLHALARLLPLERIFQTALSVDSSRMDFQFLFSSLRHCSNVERLLEVVLHLCFGGSIPMGRMMRHICSSMNQSPAFFGPSPFEKHGETKDGHACFGMIMGMTWARRINVQIFCVYIPIQSKVSCSMCPIVILRANVK